MRLALKVEELPSGSYYVSSPELAGLTLLLRDLREADSDLPWAVERLMALEHGLRVHASFLDDMPAEKALRDTNPVMELVELPARGPSMDDQSGAASASRRTWQID